jgi:hypothetical protein
LGHSARIYDPGQCTKALEKHQTVTRILHEAVAWLSEGLIAKDWPIRHLGSALLRNIELLAEALGAMAAIKAVTRSQRAIYDSRRILGV